MSESFSSEFSGFCRPSAELPRARSYQKWLCNRRRSSKCLSCNGGNSEDHISASVELPPFRAQQSQVLSTSCLVFITFVNRQETVFGRPACIPTYIHTYMHTWMHTYIHTYIHTCGRTCVHTHIPTYIHTNLYIHK